MQYVREKKSSTKYTVGFCGDGKTSSNIHGARTYISPTLLPLLILYLLALFFLQKYFACRRNYRVYEFARISDRRSTPIGQIINRFFNSAWRFTTTTTDISVNIDMDIFSCLRSDRWAARMWRCRAVKVSCPSPLISSFFVWQIWIGLWKRIKHDFQIVWVACQIVW